MSGTHFSGPIRLGTKSMLLSDDVGGISAAVTLTAEESNGTHYILGAVGKAITLPAPVKGWRTKFTVGADFTTDFVFTAATAGQFQGCVIEAGAVQDVDGKDTMTLEDGADNIGDFIEFYSDGTSIFCVGNFLSLTSVTPG